ncbi:MAG: glycosyltransferase family 4 protein [Gammaproteobacteria bacterium]|nr:glycosyltransferase family 4 protein [Gammaproteobacteria bacterium]
MRDHIQIFIDIRRARPYVDNAFYLAHNRDVAKSDWDPVKHFCLHGWREGRDPNPFFSVTAYRSFVPKLEVANENPLLHALSNRLYEPFLEWQGHEVTTVPGRTQNEILRKAMDRDWYLTQYPEVARSGQTPEHHYLNEGAKKGYDPSPRFSTRYYLAANPDVAAAEDMNPLVHWELHGRKEGRRGIIDATTTDILNRFQEGLLAEEVAWATTLDPLVAHPDQERTVTSPKDYPVGARAAVAALRRRFAGRRFDYVVTIPHVRMSGAARVAGHFIRALGTVRPKASILLVLTDLSVLEHPEWFPDGCEILDLAAHWTEGLPYDARITVLLDLIYGVEARIVMNINSRLAWDAVAIYGRQLSQELAIGTYLFTWEETISGRRTGYPIHFLRECANHIDHIVCDADHLVRDVCERFGFLQGQSGQVQVLRTPMGNVGAFSPKAKCGARKVLWAGRFDRQKRPDILAAIAAELPDLTFDAFGKSVLNKGGEAVLDDLPNVRLKGEFGALDEVAGDSYGMFLYTAQWDGMPTIVLDAIRVGLPVIAPDVGGLSEVINAETGWLVDHHDDVEGYRKAVNEVLAQPEEAQRRAEAAFYQSQSDVCRGALPGGC